MAKRVRKAVKLSANAIKRATEKVKKELKFLLKSGIIDKKEAKKLFNAFKTELKAEKERIKKFAKQELKREVKKAKKKAKPIVKKAVKRVKSRMKRKR